MNTPAELIEAIGRKTIRGLFDPEVGDSAITMAKSRGVPASWWAVLSDYCQENGVECPRELFNFKSPSSESTPSSEATD